MFVNEVLLFSTFILIHLQINFKEEFFNNAPAISTRFHVLELLPGLGKKLMHEILDERRKKPLKN